MYVRNLKLRNFRNYEQAEIELDPQLNVITGRNAQGKTNLLEALVYLSLTRSHRVRDDQKMIREGSSFADIRCVYVTDKEREIEAVIHNKGKTLMVHHQPVKKSSEFIGLINVVLFSPDDLRLFSDPPGSRRKVMNQEIGKLSSSYLLALNRFQNLLKERNALLKSNHIDPALLDTLDEEMSHCEALIWKERKQFTDSIDERIGSYYQKIADDDTGLHLHYKGIIDQPEDDIENEILKIHTESRNKDMEYRSTTTGIHHDDFVFEMYGNNITSFASQGQKRMTMLAFKMTQLAYIKKQIQQTPILLLDDVLSELDLTRQKKLLSLVKGSCQCLITTTEIPEFLKNEDMHEYRIEHGTIQRRYK